MEKCSARVCGARGRGLQPHWGMVGERAGQTPKRGRRATEKRARHTVTTEAIQLLSFSAQLVRRHGGARSGFTSVEVERVKARVSKALCSHLGRAQRLRSVPLFRGGCALHRLAGLQHHDLGPEQPAGGEKRRFN